MDKSGNWVMGAAVVMVAVKNAELFDALKEGFTAADRALIQAIAKKLGV